MKRIIDVLEIVGFLIGVLIFYLVLITYFEKVALWFFRKISKGFLKLIEIGRNQVSYGKCGSLNRKERREQIYGNLSRNDRRAAMNYRNREVERKIHVRNCRVN